MCWKDGPYDFLWVQAPGCPHCASAQQLVLPVPSQRPGTAARCTAAQRTAAPSPWDLHCSPCLQPLPAPAPEPSCHFSAALPSSQTPHQHTCIVNHSVASPKPFAAVLCWLTTQRSHAVSQCCKDNTSGTAKPKPTALLGPKDDTTAAANSEQFLPKTNWHPLVHAFLLF